MYGVVYEMDSRRARQVRGSAEQHRQTCSRGKQVTVKARKVNTGITLEQNKKKFNYKARFKKLGKTDELGKFMNGKVQVVSGTDQAEDGK